MTPSSTPIGPTPEVNRGQCFVWPRVTLRRRTLLGEVVLCPPSEPRELMDTALTIWMLFETPTRVGDVTEVLANTFEGCPERIRADVEDFVGELVGLGMLELADEPAIGAAAT